MKNRESMPVGIVVERRRSNHPWQDHSWHVVSLIPGTSAGGGWRLLYEGDGWTRYHAATLDIELFPSGTAGYRHNLSQRAPRIYVVSRRDDDDRPQPVVATVDAFEVTDYFDSADNHVEGLPMPDDIAAWIAGYVARYHREVPFEKRRRKPHGPGKSGGNDGADDGAG